MTRPRILIYDLGGCEGCPLSIMRIYPQLSRLAEVSARCIGSVRLDQEYDIAVVTGPVCMNSTEHVEALKRIRERSRILVAYGSCAAVGGIMLFARGGQEPRPDHRLYKPVNRVVEADYAIPGCPPAPSMLISLINCLRLGKGYFLSLFHAAARAGKLSGFDLMDDVVLSGICVGCGACVLSCPTNALHMVEGKPDLMAEKCIRCGTCTVRCPRFSQLLIRRHGSGEVKLL